MRSVMSVLSSVIRTIHLVVSDFPFADVDHSKLPSHLNLSSLTGSEARLRIAQTPRWLDFGSLGCKDGLKNPRPALQLVAHSEIFHLPSRVDEVDEGEWRNRALPSFNSKVIESRLGWGPSLVRSAGQHEAETRPKTYCPLTTISSCSSLTHYPTFIPRYTVL
jgi:3-O-alpha-D-mannopyranosyl-alpha-D-mannopyranose xylosylphosphotransferase